MTYSGTNNVTVGDFTKKSHYDQVLNNTIALNSGLNNAMLLYASKLTTATYNVTGSFADVAPGSGDTLVVTSPPVGTYLAISTMSIKVVDDEDPPVLGAHIQLYHSGGTVPQTIRGEFAPDITGWPASNSELWLPMSLACVFTTTTTGNISIQAKQSTDTDSAIVQAGASLLLFNFFTSL